jgi:hypothetical protein
MIIKVTQIHIDKGLIGTTRRHPVALALTDAGFQDVQVGFHLISHRNGRLSVNHEMINVLRDFARGKTYTFAIRTNNH